MSEIHLYLNEQLQVQKSLQRISQLQFDIAIIETAFLDKIVKLVDDDDYIIIWHQAIVRIYSGCGSGRTHTMEDLTVAEAEKVCNIMDNLNFHYPTSNIHATFKVKVNCEACWSSKKCKTGPPKADLKADDFSIILGSSSPPSDKKTKTRTSKLVEQQSTRLDAIRTAGDFQRQLMDRHRCTDANCRNKDSFCFPDPMDPTRHYIIDFVQHEAWANAIACGEATILTLPAHLLAYWKTEQGAINKAYKQPIKTSAIQ